MKISKHAYKRMKERGINEKIVSIMQLILPAKHLNDSTQIFLDRKTGYRLARILRKTADSIEKHIGAYIILDVATEKLITAYKRK